VVCALVDDRSRGRGVGGGSSSSSSSTSEEEPAENRWRGSEGGSYKIDLRAS